MWNKRHALACLAALCLLAGRAHTQVTPLIFEREDIRITSPAAVTVISTSNTADANKSDTAKDTPATDISTLGATGHPPLAFNVEVRSEDALRLEYIHTLNALDDTSGVLIAFSGPSSYNLPAFHVPTPVDAIFVRDNGVIEQIVPNVVLADLTQEITARKPFKAFLFLKAGTVAAKNIKPQDVIESHVFSANPAMLR